RCATAPARRSTPRGACSSVSSQPPMPVSAEPAAANPPRAEAELEERLSRPTPALTELLATVPGDLVVLGAGGKMGPSLARMARRADPRRRVIAVSRWSDRVAAA